MKPMWQQQQQQQQMQQQRQQMGWWYSKKKKEAEQEAARQAQLRVQERNKFRQAEANIAQLRRDFAAGRLTASQLESQLKNEMVQDAQGNFWMLGSESNRWYRNNGADWVEDTPAAFDDRSATPVPPKRRWFSGLLVLLGGAAISFFIGVSAKTPVIFLAGLIVTIIIAWKVWR